MARPGGGQVDAAGSSGGGDIEDKDAKHALDSIGKIVHDKVKKEAQKRSNGDLKGNLKEAKGSEELASSIETCTFEYNELAGGDAGGERYPCGNTNVERFSVKQGAECHWRKIKDSKNYRGACAPYRRLHVCDKNMENMDTNNDGKAKDNLLLEVCLAAKHEGQSISDYYPKYQAQYPGSGSGFTLCTMLARSFADIGDIVRGRDLYRGDNREKTKLEERLKTMFQNIKDNNRKLNDLSIKQVREDWWTANRDQVWKAMTCSDKLANAQYFRPTCGGHNENTTFRTPSQCRCGDDKPKAIKAGGNVSIVPTYFDYVPQFLRWFEEWAEDFCRKRKKKLNDAITNCRGKGEDGKPRYCDLNRYDCTQTASGEKKFGQRDDCIGCHYSCFDFVKWIDKQKVEFDKQKKKYTSEISDGDSGRRRKKQSATTKVYDGYEKKFYEKFKSKCRTVNVFLGLLNKETTCKDPPEEGTEKADPVDFTEDTHTTFSHTEYCQACPWCGVKKQNGKEKWEAKGDEECANEVTKEYKEEHTTTIEILTPQEQPDIFQKYKRFCDSVNGKNGANGREGGSDGGASAHVASGGGTGVVGGGSGGVAGGGVAGGGGGGVAGGGGVGSGGGDSGGGGSGGGASGVAAGGSGAGGTGTSGGENGKKGEKGKKGDQIKKWICYYDENENSDGMKDINFCVLQNNETVRSKKNSMHYNAFFWKWVHDMLHDSVEWKRELSMCINNNTNGKTCKKNKCNDKCKCYESWAKRKEEEWGQIKVHFGKQKNIRKPGAFDFGFTHEILLELLLKDGYLLQNIKDVHGDTDDIEHIKKLLKDEKNEENEEIEENEESEENVLEDNQNKTTIDKLLKHEEKEAKKCKKCQETQPESPGEEGGADPSPATGPRGPTESDHDNADTYDSEEEDDEDEDEPEEDTEGPAKKEGSEDQEASEDTNGDTEATAVETKKDVDVCQIVNDILTTSNSLNEACKQKYDGKYYGWKCVPTSGGSDSTTKPGSEPTDDRSVRGKRSAETIRDSGNTTGAVTTTGGEAPGKSDASGSICVPPRRRRLYVGKLKEWADNSGSNTQESKSSQGSTQASSEAAPAPSQSESDKLRNAFIESAAIETFFLWDRYKKLNTPQSGSSLLPLPTVLGSDSVEKTPQQQLESGDIPPSFLRQMFYTLGDYRDICVGKTPDGIDKVSASDKTKDQGSDKVTMDEIQNKIQEHINSGSKAGDPPKPSDDPRKTWWELHGPDIWNGMIYALTYKDNSETAPKGQTPTQDPTVRTKLWDSDKNKPKKDNGQQDYTYEKVVLKEEVNGAKGNDDTTQTPSSSGENTHLSKFVERPPYFRYLEEWGQNFCKERKKRLDKIKEECRSDKTGRTYCSGDGHDCTENGDLKHNNMFAELDCRPCYEQCRKYRKWIDIKFEEYHKQEKKYKGELQKLNCNSNGGVDNTCCEEIKKKKNAADFLQSLKHCKDNQGNSDQDDEDRQNKIDFKNITQTFSPSTYCKTCPPNKVTCNGGGRRSGGTNPCTAVNGNEWENVFKKTNGNSTANITVEMIDRRGPFIEEYVEKKSEKSFKDSYLFKSLRTDEWECRFNKEKKMDVCKLNKFDANIDLNDYTTFKVLLIYWLDDFLYGYYLLKKKKIIEQCRKNGEKTCDEKYQKNCVCVKKWVDQKKKEWDQIKNYYDANFKTKGEPIYSRIESFFNQQLFDSAIKKDKGKVTQLSDLEKSVGCNCNNNSEKEGAEDADKKDIVECIHENLEKKIGECTSQPSGENPTQCQNLSPVEDGDEPLEETENPVGKQEPSFCNIEDTTEETVDEGGCTPDVKEEEKEEKEKEKNKADKEDDVSPPSAPGPAPATPPLAPSDESILHTTIPFGIAIALTSIVFLFLKKKMKKKKKRKKKYKKKFIKIKKKKKKGEKYFKNNKN